MRKKILIGLGLLIVVFALWGIRRSFKKSHSLSSAEKVSSKKQLFPVKIYRIRPKKLEGVLARNGTVRSRSETNLQFGVSGRVVKFDVDKGHFVNKGKLIARLDQSEAKNVLRSAEIDFQKASVKYFQDRVIDKLEFERAKLRYNQYKKDSDVVIGY